MVQKSFDKANLLITRDDQAVKSGVVRVDTNRQIVYMNIIKILMDMFQKVFLKDGVFRIKLWYILMNTKPVVQAFKAIREEVKKL